MLDDATIKMVMVSTNNPGTLAEPLKQHVLAVVPKTDSKILPIVVGPFDATLFTLALIEKEESNLGLLQNLTRQATAPIHFVFITHLKDVSRLKGVICGNPGLKAGGM